MNEARFGVFDLHYSLFSERCLDWSLSGDRMKKLQNAKGGIPGVPYIDYKNQPLSIACAS